MTILIKSAAGKLLKAEGKIWDQNSVTDCDCPCYDEIECDDTSTIERINIKGSGKWGYEWSISHPGGTYYYNPPSSFAREIWVVPAFETSGSFLINFPSVLRSWTYNTPIEDNLTVDNWSTISAELNNCNTGIGGDEFFVPKEDIYYMKYNVGRTQEYRFGVQADFTESIYATETHTIPIYINNLPPNQTGESSYTKTFSLFIGGGLKTSKHCGYLCCDDFYQGEYRDETPQSLQPSDCGTNTIDNIGLGFPGGGSWLPHEYSDDYEATYTEHTPTWSHEVKGTA